MEEQPFNVPLQTVKLELRRGLIECGKRGLMHSAKWLAEMCYGLNHIDIDSAATTTSTTAGISNMTSTEMDTNTTGDYPLANAYLDGIAITEYDDYMLAKTYFDLREYDRAAYFVRNCESAVPRFLHLYSTYMAREKRRLDSTTDQTNLVESANLRDIAELMSELRTEYGKGNLDGYGMYLYGIVLKALSLNQVAVPVFAHAIRLVPTLWAAYLELSPLIEDKDKLPALDLGNHWMRHFFIAHTYLELYLNDEGLKAYEDLQNAGFRKCVYVTSQMAMAYHNMRDVDKAIEIFQILQETDPYRLDNMDMYSNLLFVKELKTDMAHLAHKAVSINKYRPETCCIIGNYYSIRCDHQNSILYFQRALKLNPKYLAAWTLMGHEFMELKNTNAAIQSYRKAVEVNKRDYRAWYGLGQSYEILKMYYYSLYYFQKAHQLRPYDSRMLVAMGETYEKLDKSGNAIKCYWKAINVGDIEGIAMYKIANLHQKLGDLETAVQCYILYCEDERAAADKQSLYNGYITLANYFENKGDYDRASHYAYKCLESDDRKAEAKSLLKTIENKRNAMKTQNSATNNINAPSTSKASAETLADADAARAAKMAAAETSSEDEMDLEISDCKNSMMVDNTNIDNDELPGTSTRISSTINRIAREMNAQNIETSSVENNTIDNDNLNIRSPSYNNINAHANTNHRRRRNSNTTAPVTATAAAATETTAAATATVDALTTTITTTSLTTVSSTTATITTTTQNTNINDDNDDNVSMEMSMISMD